MNFKTTLVLAIILGLSAMALFLVRSNTTSATSTITPTPSPPTNLTARDLVDDKLGDIVKVVAQRKGKDEWVFEKKESEDGGNAAWEMAAPLQTKVVSWEVENFGRQLGQLRYEISYGSGQAGAVSAATAGLEPPEATVTLTDVDGKSVGFEIGLPASENSTYVRLVGNDTIYVGQANLKNLFKANAVAYRDKSAWSFDVTAVTQVEIVDRNTDPAVHYKFVRDGARWMMESPLAARATDKVNAALQAISRLRAIEWMDISNTSLSTYGLESPALTMNVTVEEKVTAASEGEDDEAPPKVETNTTVYSLGVSDRSPIGEDTKTYVSTGDERAVATVMKTTTDKLMPDMKTWRDLKITTAKITAATHLEVNSGGESFTLIRNNNVWTFQDDKTADTSAVDQLLNTINDMTAVAYVDADPDSLPQYGFDQPQAEVRLTVPGSDSVERFTVGGFTDPNTKLLVYVRHNESSSIAKVKPDTIQTLLREKRAYQDHFINNVPASMFSYITLITTDRHEIKERSITLSQQNGEWSMTEPANAAVRSERAQGLANNLSALKAEAIVTDSDNQFATYGLDQPSARVTIALSSSNASDGKDSEITLTYAKQDGQCYVHHMDRTGVYKIDCRVYDQIGLEYRSDEIFSFDDSKVREFSIRSLEQYHVFANLGDGWVYKLEPDLPLNDSKVDELLLRIRDLKTNRYAVYGVRNAGDLGFSHPAHEVSITFDDGKYKTLLITDQMQSIGSDRGFLSMLEDGSDAFLVSTDTLNRFKVTMSELEQ